MPKINAFSRRWTARKGFTLIELMIAVAVTGILAAIAFPSYSDYVRRSNASEAVTMLAEYMLRMEQASQDNGNYGTGTCAVTLPAATKYFTPTCVLGANAATYVAKVTGTGAMTGYTYAINEAGARQTTAFVGASSLPSNCWIIRTGEC
jgi:type IV pilus assembly protein PilE